MAKQTRRRVSKRRSVRRGGQPMGLYRGPIQRTISSPVSTIKKAPAETKALAEQLGDSVTDAVKTTQAHYIRNKDKLRRGTQGMLDSFKSFGTNLTQRLGSLFGGKRRTKRTLRHKRGKKGNRR